MSYIHRTAPLRSLLDGVARAVREPAAGRSGAVATVLARHAAAPDLLEGFDCPPGADRYVRHLLHADPAGGYAVVALVWRPGQMSPVHAHRTWCALAVHRGILTEQFFAAEAGELVPVASHLRRPGAASHGPADLTAAHRIGNLGCRPAVSIHVYGAAWDRFGEDVNEVLAA